MPLFVSALLTVCVSGSLTVGVDGGYTDVMVRLEDGVGVEDCSQFLSHLRLLLTEASQVLNDELRGRAYFHSFVVEVPGSWEEEKCNYVADLR